MADLIAGRGQKLLLARAGRDRDAHHFGDHAGAAGDHKLDVLASRQDNRVMSFESSIVCLERAPCQ